MRCAPDATCPVHAHSRHSRRTGRAGRSVLGLCPSAAAPCGRGRGAAEGRADRFPPAALGNPRAGRASCGGGGRCGVRPRPGAVSSRRSLPKRDRRLLATRQGRAPARGACSGLAERDRPSRLRLLRAEVLGTGAFAAPRRRPAPGASTAERPGGPSPRGLGSPQGSSRRADPAPSSRAAALRLLRLLRLLLGRERRGGCAASGSGGGACGTPRPSRTPLLQSGCPRPSRRRTVACATGHPFPHLPAESARRATARLRLCGPRGALRGRAARREAPPRARGADAHVRALGARSRCAFSSRAAAESQARVPPVPGRPALLRRPRLGSAVRERSRRRFLPPRAAGRGRRVLGPARRGGRKGPRTGGSRQPGRGGRPRRGQRLPSRRRPAALLPLAVPEPGARRDPARGRLRRDVAFPLGCSAARVKRSVAQSEFSLQRGQRGARSSCGHTPRPAVRRDALRVPCRSSSLTDLVPRARQVAPQVASGLAHAGLHASRRPPARLRPRLSLPPFRSFCLSEHGRRVERETPAPCRAGLDPGTSGPDLSQKQTLHPRSHPGAPMYSFELVFL